MNNYLFLDIDGVINATGALLDHNESRRPWRDFELVNGEQWGETVSPTMISRLKALIIKHKIKVVWLSSWQATAPAFGHKIGLDGSLDWPWLSTEDAHGQWGKYVSIESYLLHRLGVSKKIAWIDDDLADEHDAAAWAVHKGILTLAPKPQHGITPAMLDQLDKHFSRGFSGAIEFATPVGGVAVNPGGSTSPGMAPLTSPIPNHAAMHAINEMPAQRRFIK